MKKNSPQKIIFHSVSAVVESFVFLLAFSASSVSRKMMLLNFGPYLGYQNINTSIARYCKKGFIRSLKDKQGNLLKGLPSCRLDLLGDFAKLKLHHWQKPWDGKWRLFIYDIPETLKHSREYLRRTLKGLGFGKIQQSCWASAYDYSSLLYGICKDQKISDHICLYEGNFFAGKPIDVLIENAWPLESVRSAYESLIDKCEDIRFLLRKENRPMQEIYNEYVCVYDQYKKVVAEDPFLPARYMTDWPYKKVEESLKGLSSSLIAKLKTISV